MDSVVQPFYDFVKISSQTGNVKPYPCVWIDENGQLTFEALDLPPDQCHLHVLKRLTIGEGAVLCNELMFGLDRWAKEDQQVDLKDIVTCLHWRRPDEVRNSDPRTIWETENWRPAIIQYSTE